MNRQIMIYYYCADDQEEQALVIGGEVCMWAEYIDATNFLQRAW